MTRLLMIMLLLVGSAFSQVSLWPTQVPTVKDAGSDSSVELGVRFTSDVAGKITAVRFYKSSNNTGTHSVTVWNWSGGLLANKATSNEPASGWVVTSLTTPVSVSPNVTYTVSYHAANGHYSDDQNYFRSSFSNPPLHALVNGGVYTYGSSPKYPTSTWKYSNYWVDVVFQPSNVVVHAAHVSWVASTSQVSVYNVYRGSFQTGPFSKIASTQSLTYTDTNVTAGATYWYTATAVDSNNNESVYATPAKGTIPTP